jgi:uncharacterized protein YcbK (DUF882 family)
VLAGFARQFAALSLSHAGVKVGSRIGLASLVLLAAAGVVHDATASNETRTLSFHHTHSGEDLTVTFKREGRYDEVALKQLNHFLRDWRTQDETVMDRHLFDILWEVYRDVDARQPIQIISSYRSPATNAMLRRRSAHTGVARFSQHMLGHAMDFYIPGVPLEQIRFAGLRLQRGGVGFYPTSGSPFVHLDTGNVRHWPRMTHDQLVRVFPDGRTVHIPTDGVPLKGFELAKADIERRGDGDGAAGLGKLNFFAALFKGKAASTTEEDDEGAAAPAATEKPAAPSVVAAAARPADPIPTPRAKPQMAALQLASADMPGIGIAKPRPAPVADKPADGKWQTPADIINARGFWDAPATPQQATPAQIAALKARQALASATDPQPTATVSSSAFEALAYAPGAAAPVDRAHVVAAALPMPHAGRPASRSLAQATEINSVVPKSTQGAVATSTRLSAASTDSPWLRIVMLSPSASRAMSVTLMGEIDMAAMRAYFIKPQAVIAMGFTDDPMQGMSCDSFSGSATARLEMTSFLMRTVALR